MPRIKCRQCLRENRSGSSVGLGNFVFSYGWFPLLKWESFLYFFSLRLSIFVTRVDDGSLASKCSSSGDQISFLKAWGFYLVVFLPFFFFNFISISCLQSVSSSLRGMLTCVCTGNVCYTAWATVYLPPLWDKNRAGNMHKFGLCLETKCRLLHSGNIYLFRILETRNCLCVLDTR